MSLPRKKSRTITVDGHRYRYLVTKPQGQVHLTIESDQEDGPVLRAQFDAKPHPLTGQAFQVTPDLVAQLIRDGLAKGWKPDAKGAKPFLLHP